jgi:hypothetical protein
MPTFTDSGIRFDYTLTSAIGGQQPQPTINPQARTVEFGTSDSTFTGSVTATALSGDPKEVKDIWRFGFIQEIYYSCRKGHYTGNVRTEDRLFNVPPDNTSPVKPIRDSRGGEMPYDGHSGDLTHGQQSQVTSDDDPKLELPLDLTVSNVVRQLNRVDGEDRFKIWLAATKETKPKRLVVLGQIEWRVTWRAAVNAGASTARVTLDQLVAHEPPDFAVAAAFSQNDPRGNNYPHDLTDIEGNDFFFRITYLNGLEVHRGEIDADPTEPSVALAKFPKKKAKARSWWDY